MSIFDGSEFVWGVAGIPGTGVNSGEKAGILSRLDALEATVVPASLEDLSDVGDLSGATNGDRLIYSSGDWVPETPAALTVVTSLPVVIDGGGAEITTGVKGDVYMAFSGTITGYVSMADQSGSSEVQIWKDSFGNYPPTVDDLLLTATITASTVGGNLSLSHAVSAGDVLRINVASVTDHQRVSVTLVISRSIGP